MNEENELQDQSLEGVETPEEEVNGELGEEGASPASQPEELEIDGKKYTKEELEDALRVREDYKSLLPEFTRRSQRLSELEKQLQTVQQSQKPEDEKLQEAKRILKEQLGVVTKEDLEQIQQAIRNESQADVQLQKAVSDLEKKYTGEKGEPKFDYNELKSSMIEKYGYDKANWPPTVDLEYEYWDLHRDYFSKLPEIKSKVEPTERSGSAPFTLAKKKIVFEPTGKDEISAEEAAKELLRE